MRSPPFFDSSTLQRSTFVVGQKSAPWRYAGLVHRLKRWRLDLTPRVKLASVTHFVSLYSLNEEFKFRNPDLSSIWWHSKLSVAHKLTTQHFIFKMIREADRERKTFFRRRQRKPIRDRRKKRISNRFIMPFYSSTKYHWMKNASYIYRYRAM